MAKKKTKQTTSQGAPAPLIIQDIIVKAPSRRVYDVGDWRTALRSADSGRVKQLYDLFDDMLIDGVLCDAVQRRIDAVTNAELTFQDAEGRDVPEITRLIDTQAWESILTTIMHCRIYGRSGCAFNIVDGRLSVQTFPAKHINLTNHTILKLDTDDTGTPYLGDSFFLVLGNERDFGLLLKAVPYAIYKRGGFGDWSQWIELFGMPQRIGKYNTYDPESRKLLEEAFEKAGSAPYVVIPKEAEVETRDSGGGSGASYNEFRQACNEEILITVLGQTLTTTQGDRGARALGEVHKEVEEGKNKSDLRFVQRVLNERVLPMLEARGLPVSGGSFIFPTSPAPLTVPDIVQLAGIMPIPTSYLHERFSIPVPEEGEPIARRQATPMDDLFADAGADDEPVANADRSFLRRLIDFFGAAPAAPGASTGKARITLNDSAPLHERLAARVADGRARYFDSELFYTIADNLLSAIRPAFKQQLNDVDITYGASDDVFITAMEQNLFHFSAAKTLAEIQQLNTAFRSAKSYGEFSRKAAAICDTFNARWQRTEYETAVLTAEAASNYHRLASKSRLYPYWRYVTVGDDRVRDEHRALNGIVLPYNDPVWDKIYPPNGWKCRCRVAPVLRHEVTADEIAASREAVEQYMTTTDWQMAVAQGWGCNRAKRSEIFTADQMYIRKFPSMAAKTMSRISPAQWGVERSLKKRMETAPEAPAKYEGTADDWWKARAVNIDGTELLPVTDYQDRTWYMPRRDYDAHTTDTKKSRAFRKGYLNRIDEILSDPDEVWLTHEHKDSNNRESRLNNWIMIKYYKGEAIACVCKIEGERMAFKSWYVVKNPNIRSGILVKKK